MEDEEERKTTKTAHEQRCCSMDILLALAFEVFVAARAKRASEERRYIGWNGIRSICVCREFGCKQEGQRCQVSILHI